MGNNYINYRRMRRRKKEKGTKRVFKEIMAENFPNQGKKTEIQIQET